MIDGLTLAELLDDPSLDPRQGYTVQAGQPPHVRRQFFEAMGLDPETGSRESGSEYIVVGAHKPSKYGWS